MGLKRALERLGPYPSLFLLALPTATVEPLKLAAVALAGEGHWITGTAMIAGCYAFSLLVVERLFVIVKPKLLQIRWFAKFWRAFVGVRTHVLQTVARWVPGNPASARPAKKDAPRKPDGDTRVVRG